jgi:hypothetical protein
MGSQRGYRTVFYVADGGGLPNDYAENNRTKEVVRWKARGQLLSQEAKAELLARVCNLDTFQKLMDSASLQEVARGKIVWIRSRISLDSTNAVGA